MTEKQTTSIMTSTVVASIFNVFLSIFSAKVFGLQGVVVTLMISFVILLILRLYSMVKQQNINLGKGFLFSLVSFGRKYCYILYDRQPYFIRSKSCFISSRNII